MSEDPPRLAPLGDPRLPVFDLLEHAVWITDVDQGRIVWANTPALELWRAPDLDELVNREPNLSETALTTLRHVRARVAGGTRVRSDRTMYPRGVPTLLEVVVSAFSLPDGRVALLVEGQPKRGAPIDPDVLRGAEAVRYAPLLVSTHDARGETLTRNAQATRAFGSDYTLLRAFADEAQGRAVLAQALAEGEFAGDALLATLGGPRWHSLQVRRIPDPVTGDPALVVSAIDITERREVERLKDEFVSVVSHELKTPLTAIRGALELVSNGVLGPLPGGAAELLSVAAEHSVRLTELIDDLLEAQRVVASELRLERAPTELAPLLARALERNAAALHARAGRFELHNEGAPVVVHADARRLQQVLARLLSNAVRHSPQGASVGVTVEARAGSVRVTVADQGPGIPAAFRDRIFQRFAQADGSATRSLGGAGLGLYLSKAVVEAHGGTLGFESEPGVRTAFHLELPTTPPADGVAQREP